MVFSSSGLGVFCLGFVSVFLDLRYLISSLKNSFTSRDPNPDIPYALITESLSQNFEPGHTSLFIIYIKSGSVTPSSAKKFAGSFPIKIQTFDSCQVEESRLLNLRYFTK